jgi:hypothetical protein
MTASLDVDLLPAGDRAVDAEVEAFFDRCPTSFAQQTIGWRDVIRGIGVDAPMFLGCRRAGELVGVLSAYRFDGPLGAILNTVPQAGPLGGVACLPSVDAEPVYEALLGAYAELGASTGCAFATVISNPFWPDAAMCERSLRADYVFENVCQVLDLDAALDERGRFTSASENLQRNLRKSESGALRIDEKQTLDAVEEWYAIHVARHTEIGATPLPKALFTGALEHMVPRGKARFFFVRLADGGEMVAGGFYVCHAQVVDALMPSVSTTHAKLGGNFLLALHSIRWAREQGFRHYNWQPSPPDSGVYRFKRQWGSRDVRYSYLTRITGDPEPFLRSTPDVIASAYRWHFALPFDRLGQSGGGKSSREAAWNALESARR